MVVFYYYFLFFKGSTARTFSILGRRLEYLCNLVSHTNGEHSNGTVGLKIANWVHILTRPKEDTRPWNPRQAITLQGRNHLQYGHHKLAPKQKQTNLLSLNPPLHAFLSFFPLHSFSSFFSSTAYLGRAMSLSWKIYEYVRIA